MVDTTSEILAKWTPAALDEYAGMSANERRLTAKEMSFNEKFCLGGMLFDRECELVKQQIREAFPNATDSAIMMMLREYVRRKYGDE